MQIFSIVSNNLDYQIFLFDKIIQSKTAEKFTLLLLKAKSKGIIRGQIRVCEGGQYIEEAITALIE